MKRILMLLISICCLQLHLVSAQKAEIEQLLLNVEKLAQFKQILKDMKKGYEVVYKGYNSIKDISKGNFDLHKAFLDGLMAVNPELARYRRVADIVRYQGYLLSEYRTAYRRFVSGGRFSPQEIDYMQKVYKNLFDRSIENLDELAMVLTANKLRMSDEERLTAIDRIYTDMEEKLVYLRGFNKRTGAVDSKREKELKELEMIRKMYGK
ncbi:MAG: hypothetical protein BGO31_05470 [Bacteroidetes bacterium 43-16]|uniref:hypothetical protein n=1 Tax=uncultured Dysgonomonas sp. TaxID=206096 RepID=UPI00092B2A97|nr:hypothetical protein [uncultured Dysgonomonas sp.]OJV52280.1 MAG: hypothetical protein BGO31_05470 [Bacteroidetes bacterium 43-16]